ncbi:hypothetical protein [Actinotalea sp. C106]|uniref:hypothetical protein n=1 Tax=Actinotalea sp. C106 TaxID=2908644 RepID=UPI002028E3CA|nr:hypothetical protein [Actinotalea sp. C106]
MPRPPALLGALLLLMSVLLPAAGATAAPTAAPTAVDPAEAPAQQEGPAVVLVGTAGLRWDDVHTLSTPALWDLSRDASIGTVAARSIRSSACPADGWLAVSAGSRAGDLPGEGYGECRTLVTPLAGGAVPGWDSFEASAAEESYDPVLGLLGQTLGDAGVPATGFGPGAAIALAGEEGQVVGEHLPLPPDPAGLSDAVGIALESSRLVVVDAGTVRDTGRATVARRDSLLGIDPEDEQGQDEASGDEQALEPAPTGEEPAGPDVISEPTRAEQVQPVDARVGAVLEAAAQADQEVVVLVVSLADSGTVARMQLAAALGPAPGDGEYGGSLLASSSTRQDGMIQATDVTPTLLDLLDVSDQVPAGAMVGAPVRPVPAAESANARFTAVLDIDQHSVVVRPLTPTFYTLLIVVNLVLYAVVTLGLNARVMGATRRISARLLPGRPARTEGLLRHPRAVLHGLRAAGVVVGSFPVATMLANLSPWWRAPSPTWALTGLVVGWMAAVSAVALLPRWRSPLLAPAAVVASATALVLLVDVVLGAPLQISAPLGVQPVVAGRFYGFNNTAFALFAASVLISAVAVADPLVRGGRRRLAGALVGVIGAVATVVNGMPGLGSDFGGPPALVPAFAILALMAAGVRLSWWRVTAVLGGAAVVVTSFAVIDWLRPPTERTHLGRFVETVLDGGLWGVVSRKLAQNLANLGGTWLTVLAIAGIALVVLVLVRPLRFAANAPDGGPFGWLSSGAPLTSLGTEAPMLRPGVIALAIALGIGFAVNDSGIVIPALGVSIAVPLLVTVCASWLLEMRERRVERVA